MQTIGKRIHYFKLKHDLKSIIDNPFFHIAFYLIGYFLLYFSNKIEPTNLAGIGLYFLVLIILFIAILFLFIKTLAKKDLSVFFKTIITIIHISGVAVIIWWVKQPNWQIEKFWIEECWSALHSNCTSPKKQLFTFKFLSKFGILKQANTKMKTYL